MSTRLPPVSINPHWLGYHCTLCGRHHGPDWRGFSCSECGSEGILDAEFDYSAVVAGIDPASLFPSHPAGGIWRFAPLLPLQPTGAHAAWSVGDTPLYAAANLGSQLGLANLYLKDDTCLPSASLKDRASAMALADARRLGVDHVACASTGNAAASLVTLAARTGLDTTIFVPAEAPAAKLAQLVLHGTDLIRVAGNYDQAYDLSLRVMEKYGWYSRNCAHNALLVEGKKTVALEIAASLDWQAPDAVFVPVGDGCIVSAVAKAFAELHEVGLCAKLPRVYGVQAAGAAPLAAAWARQKDSHEDLDGHDILAAVQPVDPETCADSIAVGVPRNRVKAWQKVAATGGGFLAVTDAEILESVHLLAREAGLFAEPSAAAGLAGLINAVRDELVEPHAQVVVLVTGHGLKDPAALLAGLQLPDPIPPDQESVDL